MARATLLLAVEGGADAARAVGTIAGASRNANAAMSADARRTAATMHSLNAESVSDALRAAAARIKAEKDFKAQFAALAKDATSIARAEAGYRQLSEVQEAGQRARLIQAGVGLLRSAEQEKTRIAKQEDRDRTRAATQEARTRARNVREALGTLNHVAHAAAGAVGDALGQARDVRARRADTAHTMNNAFNQAGADATEQATLRARVYRFVQSREGAGLSSADVAGGLLNAQTEQSSLNVTDEQRRRGLTAPQARAENLEAQLRAATFARNTYQDPGEVMRVAGLMTNAGITGQTQHNAMLALTGFAQRGAVNLSDVTSTAMAPIERRMASAAARTRAANPNATEGEVSRAQQHALLQTFAEMEVARGVGESPRTVGNITAGIETRLQNTGVQSRMLHNIDAAHGISEEQRTRLHAMFDHGHLGAQYQSMLGLAHGLREAGIDASTASNIFGGTGRGNPMSMRDPERRIMGTFMANEGAIRRMVDGAGTDFTDENVASGEASVLAEDKTRMTQEAEGHDEIVANTTALTQMTAVLSQFQAQHPLLDSALKVLPGGEAAEHVAAQFSHEVTSDYALPIQQAGYRKFQEARARGDYSQSQDSYIEREASSRHHDVTKADKGHDPLANSAPAIMAAVRDGIREGMRTVTVTAAISPHDAAHTAAGTLSGPASPPPESRSH